MGACGFPRSICPRRGNPGRARFWLGAAQPSSGGFHTQGKCLSPGLDFEADLPFAGGVPGHLRDVVHYGFIEKFIVELGERFNIREIGYDRWNASMMVQALEEDGFTMVPFGQGFRDMSAPTKELMRLVLEHRINHGGHPVLRWNMDNAFVRTDPAGNIKIDKEKSTEKVDGAVAMVMALDRAMKNQNGGSVYDTRGLLVLG